MKRLELSKRLQELADAALRKPDEVKDEELGYCIQEINKEWTEEVERREGNAVCV